ncbi:hypothetical protein ACFL6P_09045 [Candidatus Latescibacterota bacterium]
MPKETAFNFPLCLLSYLGNTKNRIDHIISYCIVETAYTLQDMGYSGYMDMESILDEELECILEDDEKIPQDYNEENKLHGMILVARKRKGITGGTIKSFIKEHKQAKAYVKDFERRFGYDAPVQINKDLCFKTRDGKFDYKMFKVICAINSVIGKEAKFKRITVKQIRHRMNGFKTQVIMDKVKKECCNNKDYIELTDKQIERLSKKVALLNFFRRYTYHKRQTFYSTRLNIEELIKAVHESKNYKLNKKNNALKAVIENETQTKKLIEENKSLKNKLQAIKGEYNKNVS